MGLFSKSKYLHRSERRERVERHVNSNPDTANPGDLAPAPQMPMLPPKPVEPEIQSCIPDLVDAKNDAMVGAALGGLVGLLGGPGGMIAGATLGASIGAAQPMIKTAYNAKDCNDKARAQYEKDLEHYSQAEAVAKEEFTQKSVEYIQYQREHEAQQNRYLDAFEKGRRTLKEDMRCGADTIKHEAKMKKERERGRSKTINQPGGTGANNPENNGFPPTGKSPTRAPLPCSDHPYVTDGTPAYHPPDPFKFQWPSEKASMTTQYNQSKASAAPAKNDYWNNYIKEKNTPRYK